MPAAYPADNPHTVNLDAFAKDVADATGGKLQITVHAGASLFKAPEIKRAVQTGQAQVGEVLISLHENEDPMFGIDVVPFVATSFDEVARSCGRHRNPQSRKNSARNPIAGRMLASGNIILIAQARPFRMRFAKVSGARESAQTCEPGP